MASKPTPTVSNYVPFKGPVAPDWSSFQGQCTMGVLVRLEQGVPWVDFPGNDQGPLAAKRTVSLADLAPGPDGAPPELMLVFPQGGPDQPVIVGRVSPPEPAPELESDNAVDVRMDGRRLVLQAQEEIELRCGEARIVLRRNGRISVRGAYVETRAKGVNRIKGGSVQIN